MNDDTHTLDNAQMPFPTCNTGIHTITNTFIETKPVSYKCSKIASNKDCHYGQV